MTKIKWQGGFHKRAAHAFLSETKVGEVSLCGREALSTGDTTDVPTRKSCGSCVKKIEKLKATDIDV